MLTVAWIVGGVGRIEELGGGSQRGAVWNRFRSCSASFSASFTFLAASSFFFFASFTACSLLPALPAQPPAPNFPPP